MLTPTICYITTKKHDNRPNLEYIFYVEYDLCCILKFAYEVFTCSHLFKTQVQNG